MYDEEALYEDAVKAINKNKLIYISDVIDILAIARETFYNYFPVGSEKSNALKRELRANKIEWKRNMRFKWYKSDKTGLQIGLYKLLANEEELTRLNKKNVDVTSKGEKLETVNNIKLNAGEYLDEEQ